MKILMVSKLDRYTRAIRTITNYIRTGRELGHEVAVFGEEQSESPLLNWSLDVKKYDFAVFVIYLPSDFPDLPYLAQLLDGMPKERRIIIDCNGRYNDTVRVEHDFNHLEKLDGHQGWEWIEGFQAVTDKILQPTLTPLREDVRSFLFHAYDPSAVARSYNTPSEAALVWGGNASTAKRYGVTYVGNNWQRWDQVKQFLEAIEPLRETLGPICLAGWDWGKRPDWAVELGLAGVDVDPSLLERLGVETRDPISFDEVIGFTSQGRFSPIFHRPLYRYLGLVTNRTFETFEADTIPLLMLPNDLVEAIYGSDAIPLMPGDDLKGRLEHVIRQPEIYWEAVLKTRSYLSKRHSYRERFTELLSILDS
jgi:hypothetical protein